MRRFFAILGVAGGVVLLVLLGVAIAVSTVDPRQFIEPIRAHVKAVTGRDIGVGGDVDLKLGLQPRIVFGDVRVGNAPWAKAPDLLTAKTIEAEVALLPLLTRRFELVRLNLVEPVISLETGAAGQGNWEFAPAKTASGPPAGDPGPGALGIDNLTITRGVLDYRDGASGAQTHVVIDELSLQARNPQSPVNAEFRGKVDGIAVALTGNLGPFATLAQRRMPYPIAVQGEVAGKKAALAVKVQRGDGEMQLQDIDAKFGESDVKGRMDAKGAGPRSTWNANLASQSLAIEDLALFGGATAPAPAHPAGGRSHFVFSDAPLSFDALRRNDLGGEMTIVRLRLEPGRVLENVHVRFSLHEGKLDVPMLTAGMFGGIVSGRLSIDAAHVAAPAITVNLDGRKLDLGPLLRAAGIARDVHGGKTDVTLAATTHGNSPHQWVSAANGRFHAVVGPASIANAKLDPDLAADRLAQAVNPYRTSMPSTELQCAVIDLPLANGVAAFERGIGAETKQMDVSVSGRLDFRDETLDLSFRPRVRQGIAIEFPQIADLVHFRGPFAKPALAVDYVASATALARIGAAIGTGGLSVLGESIAAGTGAGACAVALGKAPAPKGAGAAGAKAAPASDPAADLGSALGKLFKK